MTDSICTQVVVNLKEGTFSLSGSESFVEKHMQELKELIEKGFKNIPCASNTADYILKDEKNSQVQHGNEKIEAAMTNKYIDSGIYYIDDVTGDVQILKSVPGKGKASKAKNVALILLYAKDDTVSSSEVIKHCTDQACFDQANFSSTFKKKDGCFIRQGNGQNWTLKLTVPGKEKAVALLESMIDVK